MNAIKSSKTFFILPVLVAVLLLAGCTNSSNTPGSSGESVTRSALLSPEAQIDSAAQEVLGGKVADGKSKFIRTVATGDTESGFDVIVEFNASSFGNRYDLKLLEMESDMTSTYQALYGSSLPINSVLINAFCTFVDEFGNDSEERCYSTALEKAAGEKINWDQDETTLSRQTVPGLWKLHFIDPELEKEIEKIDD